MEETPTVEDRRGWTQKIRPNILIAMVLIGTLGMGISAIGWRLGNEGIISAAGVGAIIAISNLAGKILEKE